MPNEDSAVTPAVTSAISSVKVSATSAEGSVVTVTGPCAPSDLGATVVAAHVIAHFAPEAGSAEEGALVAVFAARVGGGSRREEAAVRQRYAAPLTIDLLGDVYLGAPNRDDQVLTDEHVAAAELAAFRAAGGGAVVDLTPADRGRDPRALRRLAERTGVRVVMGAGWRCPPTELAGSAATGPGATLSDADSPVATDEEAFATRLVDDIRSGVDGVRAGVIGKLAPLDVRIPSERSLVHAAARASYLTGAPIVMDLADDVTVAIGALDAIAARGVDLSRVAIAGCDRHSPAPDALELLLARGAYALFNGLGQLPTARSTWDDGDVAAAVSELARRGYGDQLLIAPASTRKHHLLAYGGGGYAFIQQQFRMFLTTVGGADEALVASLTAANPQRFLTFAARGAA